MQWINTDRDNLLKPLQIVTGIVERRQSLPILGNVLLEKNGSSIKFVSTDLEIQIKTGADIGFGEKNSQLTVSARKLQEILQVLPKGNLVIEQKESNQLIIKSGKSRFSLQTLPAEEFPELIIDQPFKVEFKVDQDKFKKLIGSTHFSMAQNDVRYYLNGLLLSLENDKLTTIATDGHRLAKASIPLGYTNSNYPLTEVIIPKKSILEIQKLLSQISSPIKISISEKHIQFTLDQTVIISKLIDGRYPDYKRVLSPDYDKCCSIIREDFQQSLQRAALLTSEKSKSVSLSFNKGSLHVDVKTPNSENLHDEIECNFCAQPIKMTFNVQYLLDLCNHLKCTSLYIDLGSPSNKIQIRLDESSSLDFYYIVMPMRI